MNRQNLLRGSKNSYIVWLITFLFVTIGPEQGYSQTFELQGREYRQLDGVWYNFANGRQGDQIVPQRLIVRLRDRSYLKAFGIEQYQKNL
ncbi:MAG: hypothetical protein IIA61_02735 [Candidatus Marinimicrobia bacterium]|nr:hypothetical protein [Candidatus Neomarinimicrobiota bacterium]